CEQGSWESGLSYECRSLLFKALHNLIERCLLSRDFIRIGKWFVQPCGAPVKRTAEGLGAGHTTSEGVNVGNAHLSFSFAFFVHGESSVCASVDVRQHPPVRRLSRWHIQQAQASTAGLKVILAPFGLSGTLTGHSFKSPEATARLLDDWSQFYPLDKSNTLTDSSVVEVIVGGVKMRYPSCYVLVTDMDETTNSPVLTGLPPASPSTAAIDERGEKRGSSPVAMVQTPPPSPVKISSRVVQPGPYTVSVEHFSSMSREQTAATILPERTWQECILGGGQNTQPENKEFSGNWDFVEPTRRTTCVCSKCRKSVGPHSNSNKWATGSGAFHRSSGKAGRAKVPFHRRFPLLPFPTERCISGSYTPQGGPPSYPRTQESTAIPSVGSPPSVAPSPLPNPHSQPASVPPGDQTMPTLSPHPPTANPSPLEKTHTPDQPPKSVDSAGNSPTTAGLVEPKSETQVTTPNVPMLKRPFLISKEYENVTNSNLFMKQAETEAPVIPNSHPHGVKRPGDPYEFEEDGGGANCNIDGFKRGQVAGVKEENKETKKITTEALFTSEGLQPSFKDLDQIFDNSDYTSSDEAVSTISCYTSLSSTTSYWSFVFKPPITCKMVGSSKYAPLTDLPSQSLPQVSLPPNFTYKPSWMQHVEKQQTNQQVNNSVTTSSNQNTPATSLPNSVHQNTNLFPPSPLHSAGTPGSFRPPPPPYEMASPATSTASSYLNKNLNSVEAAPTPTPGILQRAPEASSLVLNILLTDTAFNIFRDHNFDSCTLCVCNAAGKVVGNIRGADAGIYLLNTQNDKQHASAQPSSPYPGSNMGQPPPYGSMMNEDHHANDEDSIRCSCGFSAVVNRRLAYGSGLFYEDEVEITGISEDPGEKKKSSLLSFLIATNSVKLDPSIDRDQIDIMPHSLIELVREQLVFIPNTTNSLCRVAGGYMRTKVNIHTSNIHLLEYSDSHDVTCIALEQSKNCLENMGLCKMEDIKQPKTSQTITVHRWPFLRATGPQCNQDIVRVMRSLQPLLQEAIQKKCQTRLWEAPSAVKGPLTWRQFHRLAGRGTDDRCEPQPIPSVIVGHDKDWLSLSPYALQHWETLLLEPYSYARDVAYIVVAPDNDAILPRVRTFFRELSTAYEMCKLGRHSPITKVLRDGILRVGKTAKYVLEGYNALSWLALDSNTKDRLSCLPVHMQIISLESIVELNKARNRIRHSDHMRALALNIFSQCRRLLLHSNNVKSLTGFGTAAMADQFLKSKDEKNRAAYKLYTPPYILAPMRGKQEPADVFSKGAQEQASVLYLSYCLSEDQSWLLAVATDEKGEIFETITINVDIPNRSRRKKASARRIGLEKLMNFILGVMSQSVRPWRLVVGRLGRIGHGELKGWSWLLSRKNLLKASKNLKEICNQCSMMYPSSVPCILSACLVSLEPDSVLRLMPDQFTPDERFSQVSVNSQLSTPQDVSCTHILVFPTSATTQSSQTAFQEQHITAEFGDDGLFDPFDDEMPEGIDGMNDFNDIFNWPETFPGGGQSPPGSPRREEGGAGSPNGSTNVGREGKNSYVLEGYNALSWLALDSNTKDRLSCLPVHMQVLVQLYNTAAALL
uniref:Mediator of RNA polymerase II transcription subunit 13 n=1 Tax=Diabrotica virgifera virgifera TaxID=50390 RepID=A0A6P7FLV9_DIAVI